MVASSPTQVRILFLAVNPRDTAPLDLKGEYDSISQILSDSPHTAGFLLQECMKVSRDQLIDVLNKYDPQILHFSGHGTEDHLILQDSEGNPWPLDSQMVREWFKVAGGSVKLVVLNACYSDSVAEGLSEITDCVIGMTGLVYDNSAIIFAEALYRALFAGLSIGQAFDQTRAQIELSGLSGKRIPQMRSRPKLDPRPLRLLDWAGVSSPSDETTGLSTPVIPRDRPGLRRALDQHLETMPDLEAFVLDHFSDVYNQRSVKMIRKELCNLLLEMKDSAMIAHALERHLQAAKSHQAPKRERETKQDVAIEPDNAPSGQQRKSRHRLKWRRFLKQMVFFWGISEIVQKVAGTVWGWLLKLWGGSQIAAGVTAVGLGAGTVVVTAVGVHEVQRHWSGAPQPRPPRPTITPDLGASTTPMDLGVNGHKDGSDNDIPDLMCAGDLNIRPPIRGMIYIPGCRFMMGSNEDAQDSKPAHAVDIGGFYLDRTEVTVEQYSRCVDAAACQEQSTLNPPPVSQHPGEDIINQISCIWNAWSKDHDRAKKYPMNCVDFTQASIYCRWQGKRLPTEEEWEYAARGIQGRKYPWGNSPATSGKGCWQRSGQGNQGMGPCPVATHEQEAAGVWDLGGNVAEWVDGWYCSQGYNANCRKVYRSVRGNHFLWPSLPPLPPAIERLGKRPETRLAAIGFRCAKTE